MALPLFTLVHVIISLVGIGSGLAVVYGFLTGRSLPTWNTLFLITTIATSVTGFFFPFHGFTPGIGLGIISLVVLAIALWARKTSRQKTYIATSSVAEYLNIVVLIVQSFQKVPLLHSYAPKGSEPIIAVVQLVMLALFVLVLTLSLRRARSSLSSTESVPQKSF